MTDESVNISAKTWLRTVDPITKAGYSDGVGDGQVAIYQTSFDTGYEQGMKFGIDLGILDARSCIDETKKETLRDPRKLNCQICLNNNTDANILNLFNVQKDNNDRFLQNISCSRPI